MIVKTSISFLNIETDPELVATTEAIITGVTGNPSYVAPVPTMPEITAAKVAFAAAMSDAADGGVTLRRSRMTSAQS